jgi:hypothetical protein
LIEFPFTVFNSALRTFGGSVGPDTAGRVGALLEVPGGSLELQLERPSETTIANARNVVTIRSGVQNFLLITLTDFFSAIFPATSYQT